MSLSLQPPVPPTAPPRCDEQSLVLAFASFSEVAASLERSYRQLQSEVTQLRHQLEHTDRDLARSLEENQRMREHLKRVVEGLPCGVLVTEADGSVSLANPETRRLLAAISGAPCDDHDLERVPVWAEEMLAEAEAAGGPLEREYRCGAESLQWMAVRRAPLQTPAGGSSIFILRDISEAKRLQQAQEALGRRQALAEMSALLAHEIRNPLGSLELFAGLLAESKLGPECRQWAEQLQAGLRTLAATVNNVLHFHSQPQPELRPTDLGQLLDWLGRFLHPLAQQAGVRLEVEHHLEGVLVAADRHRLEQVVLNLAINAFRFMPQGGTLEISGAKNFGERKLNAKKALAKKIDAKNMSAEKMDAKKMTAEKIDAKKIAIAEVLLADTGPGIPAQNADLIFQPGFTTRPGSPGLGLAVCKTIMEQHGGTIAVASHPGRGCTFRLQFPVLGDSR